MFIRFTLFLFFYFELYTFEKYPNKPEALLFDWASLALVEAVWASCPCVMALGWGWSWAFFFSHPHVSSFLLFLLCHGTCSDDFSSVPSFLSSVSQPHLLSPSLLLAPLCPVWALAHLLPEAPGRPWPQGPTAVSRLPCCHPS